MTFSSPRLAPAVLSALLAALPCLPWGQAHAAPSSTPNAAAQAQQALERGLDAALGGEGLPRQVKWEVSRQGFAELLEMESHIVGQGLVSPRGWVLDCPGLARYSRQWLDRTNTLTGVYLGASWLEHWSVECKPRQAQVWPRRDARRITRAVNRAVEALPAQWADVSAAYSPPEVKKYVRAINASGGISVPNRECAREVSAKVREGVLSVAQASHRHRQCPASSEHGVLEDLAQEERYEGVALAVALDTPFLGLNRWLVEPAVLAGVVGNPDAIQMLLVEMAVLTPSSSVLAVREPWFAHPAVAALIQTQNDTGASHQENLTQKVAPVFVNWPTQTACQQAGAALRASIAETSSISFLFGTLALWPRLAVVCPQQSPSTQDQKLVEQAQLRAGQVLPPGSARDVLMAPLFEEYLAEFQSHHPPSRQACVSGVLEQTKALPDTLQQGLRSARALCPVAYQSQFHTPLESQ